MEIIKINQKTAIRLGLNLSEACVLDYLKQRSEYCDWFSLHVMACELPFISDKADTLYRIIKSLEGMGVISINKTHKAEYSFLLTFNGTW